MKTHLATHCHTAFKRTSRQIIGCAAALAFATAPLFAEVKVEFLNTGLLGSAGTSIGTVTLEFTVDDSGNVTLDASTSVTANSAIVDAWDGPVGTISHTGAYDSTFSMTMAGIGTRTGSSSDLRITDVIATGSTGGIVGVQGINQYRIDNDNGEVMRFTATSVPAGSKLKITSMEWLNANGNPTQTASSPAPAINVTNAVTTAGGNWNLASSGFLLDSTQVVNFGTTTTGDTSKGYSFRAISFDIVNASSLLAPTGLTATTNGQSVVLDWNDTLNATSYSVYRSESISDPFGDPIASGLTSSTYTDNAVTTGTTYYYVVTASDGTNETADSNEVNVSVVIPAPTGLTRIQGNGVINLNWDDSTSPIFASYSVYRSTTSGGPYTSIATGLPTSDYDDTDVTNGTTYYYVVRAVDNVEGSGAESANSAQVSGTPYVPISGSTLYAHLDASVNTSITATDEIVSLWADRTANGLNATIASPPVGEVYYPSLSSSGTGLGGIDFGYSGFDGTAKSTLNWFTPAQQDSWLDFSSGAGALPYSGFAVFAVVHPNAILAGNQRDVVMSSTDDKFSLRYENGKPELRLGGIRAGTPLSSGVAAPVSAGQTVLLAVNYDASSGLLQIWDSASSTIRNATVPAADFSSTSNFFLGGSLNPDQYMKGMIGEVKVYRGVMTADEYLAERASLVEKWVSDPIPSGFTLTPGVGKVDLQWTKIAPNSAYTYSVYRSTTPGGSYELLTSGLTDGAYSDTTVDRGVTYYYVVTSTNNTLNPPVESALSSEVSGSSIAPVLHAHLDASVTASVTTDGSNIVSTWADQTANDLNATSTDAAGTVFFPSSTQTQSGLNGLDMGLIVDETTDPPTPPKSTLAWMNQTQQRQWLDFSPSGAALAKGGFAVYAVVHPTAILGGSNRDVVMSSTEDDFAIRYEQGTPQVRLGDGTVAGTTILNGPVGSVTAGRTVVIAVSYDAATGSLKIWDSNSRVVTTNPTPVAAADFSAEARIFLGGSANPDQYMKGVLGEVKVYTGLVTDDELVNEAKSMLVTWGIPDLNWTGAESSEWSTATLLGAKNWAAIGPVARDFMNGSAVIFDDTATSYTVEIDEENLTPSSVTFSSGTYTLGGTSTFANTTPVSIANGATLKLGSSNMLPDGQGAGNLTLNGMLDLNGNSETLNGLLGAGSVDNTATGTTSTLTVGVNGGGIFSGAIQNNGGTLALIKTGPTDLILTGTNTYSGATTVNQNRLFISGPSAFSPNTAVTVNNGGSFILNTSGSPAFAQSITLNSGSTLSMRQAATLSNVTLPTAGSVRFNFDDVTTQALSLASAVVLDDSLAVQVGGGTGTTVGAVTLSGTLSGEGGLVKTGPGQLNITGANTFEGGVGILNGTVNAGTNNTAMGSGTISMGGDGSQGATFVTGRTIANPFTINLPASGTIVIGANGAGSGYTLSGGITLNGNLTVRTFNNPIANDINGNPITASAGLTGGITGTGDLVLNNTGLAANRIDITAKAINHTGTITVQGTGTGNTTIGANIGSNVTGITQNSASSPLILSGANTYACNLTVNAGIVTISNNSNIANDVSTVSIATNARLNLNYSGTDKVAKLIIDGVEQEAGVYGAEGSESPVIGIAQITGTGTLSVGAAEILVEQPVDTVIASGDSQGFGEVDLGANTSLTFTIRNTGNAELNLTSVPAVAISGDNAEDFTVTEEPSASVAAGATTTFTVTFAPSAAGERTATLTIANDSANAAPYVINLTGTGIGGTTPSDPFAEWSGDLAFDDDANGDGVSNGLAWILGAADPNANARSLLPTVSTTATDMVFTFKRNQDSIDDTIALSVEAGTTLAAWPGTYTVGADTDGSSEGVAIAKDSPAAGTDTVTVTIPRASNTKLFARLKAVIEELPAQ